MNQILNGSFRRANAKRLNGVAECPTMSSSVSGHTAIWKVICVMLFTLMQLTFGAPKAHAATISCSLQSALNFAPALNTSGFGRDATVGGTTPNYSTPVNFHCDGDPGADRDIYVWFQVSSATLVSGYTDLFKTNIDSVGVRYTISNGTGTSCNSVPVNVFNGKVQVVCHQLHQAASPGQNYSLIVSAQFVKLSSGAVGPLTTIPTLAVSNGVNNQGGSTTWGNVFTGSVNGSFSTLTCSVTTSSVAVSMSQANTNRMPAIGSTDRPTPFNIGLNCDPGVKAFMTLTDATVPSNTSNTLSLGTESTAKGLGYQILYNDNPVSFGLDSAIAGNQNQFSVMASPAAGGRVNVPLTARFIRTGAMEPGTVIAKATFTMSYQ
ncbi:fimbrial protein [Paraburkholderia domus]|uniref:fimbrial protein n=1 Tax=Paraburkholderia domus TaxID=2793075 RepID=UPI001B1528F8|nr:fimbrial protein [Paraburkholderia domus]CAE6738120.1 hypothetical protein R75483_02530 [Paraburkholderia domus]